MAIGVCIVGYGRAGRIQLNSCVEEGGMNIVCVLDKQNVGGWKEEETFEEFLFSFLVRSEEVDSVIVTTPTPTHFEICKICLEAGKNVFVEKPLACGRKEVEDLFLLARKKEKLLYTAFNRRHDPAWRELASRCEGREVFHATFLCRDFPFPSPSYLSSCGGIVRDAAVHDIDMACTFLFKGRDPLSVQCRLDERGETSSCLLHFSGGGTANFLHSRHSTRYDQRAFVFHEEGMEEMDCGDAKEGTSFSARYSDSYVLQLRDFRQKVEYGDMEPNASLSYSLLLEDILDACHDSSSSHGRTIFLGH
jgi:myo-inositol 2-dehydrogenase/D-chiro-inositol 1-dehydrogenase